MRNYKTFSGFLMGAMLILTPLAAHAGAAVTAVYKVLAIQPDVQGSILSLDVTVTNSGSVDLNSLVLEASDPTRGDSIINRLNVGNLAAANHGVLQWVIQSAIPADQLPASMPLYLQAHALDGQGHPVKVDVEGVAQ